MFLKSHFSVRLHQCPRYDSRTGRTLFEKNWRSVMLLMDEAQFEDDKNKKVFLHMDDGIKIKRQVPSGSKKPMNDMLMQQRIRFVPYLLRHTFQECIRLMMKKYWIYFPEMISHSMRLELRNGDRKKKINLFIVIPDDDDIALTFVPGIIYSLWFSSCMLRQDFFQAPEIYQCLFAVFVTKWKRYLKRRGMEGLVSNQIPLYLGGNEQSTYEYIEKYPIFISIKNTTVTKSKKSYSLKHRKS